MERFFAKHRFLILFMLAAGAFVLWQDSSRLASQSDGLYAYFFSVGQGDAELVVTPSGKKLLIDGGPGTDIVAQLAGVMPFWPRTIDLMVLTHPQRDHAGGLAAVLGRYRVGRVLITGAAYALPEYAALLAAAQSRGVPVMLARAGENIAFGDGASLHVLEPGSAAVSSSASDANDASVVLRLDYGKTSFLFTGDAGFGAEASLVSSGEAARGIDILKVGHHGSKYASGESFLRAMAPKVAVIEVGKNSYGHPAPETLSRLANAGARVFRTDNDGTVEFFTDGAAVSRVFAPRCAVPLFCHDVRERLFAE